MKNTSFILSNKNRIEKLVKKFQGYSTPPSKTKLTKFLANFQSDEVETGLKLLEKIDFFNNKRTSNLMKTLYKRIQKIGDVDKLLILPIDPRSGSSSYRMIEKFRCVNNMKPRKYDSIFLSGFDKSLLDSLMDAKNKNIVFIDDMIGSGTSFVSFYNDISSTYDDTCKYYVAVITAHKEGLEFIKSTTPVTIISATRTIPHTKKILHPNNPCFSEHERVILKKYCKRMQVKKELMFGYKEMASPVIFYEKTPNNVMPILYDKRKNWDTVFSN